MQASSNAPSIRRADTGSSSDGEARHALAHGLVLLALAGGVFWRDLLHFAGMATTIVDWTHGLVFPIAAVVLFYRRRAVLAAERSSGSIWGLVLILLGLMIYAGTNWPITVGYLHDLQIVTVAAGIVLAVGGWGVLTRCIPMLLLLLLSIPIGQSIYATLSIKPETVTLAAARFVLNLLPSVSVQLHGPDLIYTSGGEVGGIALGLPHRGASLLLAYVGIGVFVTFARIRPFGHVLLLAIAAGPVALLCNLMRLVFIGVATIYTGVSPLNHMPRNVGSVGSLLLAYLLFVCASAFLGLLEGDGDQAEEDSLDA
jgi:exosortase/archaeosortase family protein